MRASRRAVVELVPALDPNDCVGIILTKVGLYGKEHPHRDVIGFGISLREVGVPPSPVGE